MNSRRFSDAIVEQPSIIVRGFGPAPGGRSSVASCGRAEGGGAPKDASFRVTPCGVASLGAGCSPSGAPPRNFFHPGTALSVPDGWTFHLRIGRAFAPPSAGTYQPTERQTLIVGTVGDPGRPGADLARTSRRRRTRSAFERLRRRPRLSRL